MLDSIRTTVGLEYSFRGCRKFGEFLVGPSRPCDKLSAAIRALALESGSRTVAAERALKGANDRFLRLRWQVTVAAFAIWTELEHWVSVVNGADD